MDKVVTHGCKIDFHIHSCHSVNKDKNAVVNLTEDHIDILIGKLIENEVNICSISDHDTFSYEMYHALKLSEGQGSIKKVLPAVEFTVSFDSDEKAENGEPVKKSVHVVTIFDDSNNDKVRKMGEFFNDTSFVKYDDILNNCFSKNKFIEILSKIDIPCLCIAHQKNSLHSPSGSQKNDANDLGEKTFNTLLTAEFFDTYEFKNRNIEIFHKMEMDLRNSNGNDFFRVVTGTDCHDWSVYPAARQSDKGGINFPFTYLKCLPNFRGVAFALTDRTRIMREDNFFAHDNNYLKSIKIKINGEEHDIPLSHGINVIIGENSIGKSLLLHKLTNEEYLANTGLSSTKIKETEKGYDAFLLKHKIDIPPGQLNDVHISQFDIQGQIRETFSAGKMDEIPFLKNKFPDDFDTTNIKSILESKLTSFTENLNAKIGYDEKRKSLTKISIEIIEELDKQVISFKRAPSNIYKKELTSVERINSNLGKTIEALKKAIKELEKFNRQDDVQQATNAETTLAKLLSHYTEYKNFILERMQILTAINNSFDVRDASNNVLRNGYEERTNEYSNIKRNFVDSIRECFEQYLEIRPIDYHVQEFDNYKFETSRSNNVLPDYKFIKKLSIDPKSDGYIKELFHCPLKDKTHVLDDIYTFNESAFEDSLDNYKKSRDGNAMKYYYKKIEEEIENSLVLVPKIVKGDDVDMGSYSSGAYSQIYFDVISCNTNPDGIYIIDQPEDDVSPVAIKEYLLDDFRKMRRNRQIIIVTHNPQFVVNLDADNVVYLFYNDDKGGSFDIRSGALEYSDDEYSIIRIVANALDGGMESIRKRWKSYEKDDINF